MQALAYIVYGSDTAGSVTHQGTSGADSLTGTAGADIMIGGLGDDLLSGATALIDDDIVVTT